MATQPFTATDFPGAPADQVASFIAEANALAGIRTEGVAPVSAPAVTPRAVPTAPAADAQREMDQIRADRADGRISDYQWRTHYEARYLELAGMKDSTSALHGHRTQAQWDMANDALALQTQQAFEHAFDADMKPPQSAHEYNLSLPDKATDEQLAGVQALRQTLFTEKVPPSSANRIDKALAPIDAELRRSPDSATQIVQRENQRLREHWGPQFDANVALVDEYLDNHPALREIIASRPVHFSAAQAGYELLELARREQRMRGGSR